MFGQKNGHYGLTLNNLNFKSYRLSHFIFYNILKNFWQKKEKG